MLTQKVWKNILSDEKSHLLSSDGFIKPAVSSASVSFLFIHMSLSLPGLTAFVNNLISTFRWQEGLKSYSLFGISEKFDNTYYEYLVTD